MLSFRLAPVSLQFHEAWKKLIDWLEDAENHLDSELEISNDPDKIKLQLSKHKVELCQSKTGAERWVKGCLVGRGAGQHLLCCEGRGKECPCFPLPWKTFLWGSSPAPCILREPGFLKQLCFLSGPQEFQKTLGGKQPVYDTTIRTGRALKEKALLADDTQKLDNLLGEVRDKWDTVCGKSVER